MNKHKARSYCNVGFHYITTEIHNSAAFTYTSVSMFKHHPNIMMANEIVKNKTYIHYRISRSFLFSRDVNISSCPEKITEGSIPTETVRNSLTPHAELNSHSLAISLSLIKMALKLYL